MRVHFLFIFLFFSFHLFSENHNRYLFFDWECNENLVFEGNIFDLNTRYEKDITFSFEDPVDIRFKNEIYIDLTLCEKNYIDALSIDLDQSIKFEQGIEKKQRRVRLEIFPLRKHKGKWQKLLYVELDVIQKSLDRRKVKASNSKLSEGDWYKIGVSSDAIHQITSQDLIDLGINLAELDPEKIQLFGHPGGMLPLNNHEFRVDDLEELNIIVDGESDGVFNQNDRVLFYGESPHQWAYDSVVSIFRHQINYFSDYTYYFLRINHVNGSRVIAESMLLDPPNFYSSSFNDFQYRASEEVNLIKSGRKWYGDQFFNNSTQSFNFNFPNNQGQIILTGSFATVVPSPYTSSYILNMNGEQKSVNALGSVGNYNFASISSFEHSFSPPDLVELEIQFLSSYSGAEGWIDYLELNARRDLKMEASQLIFRDIETVNKGVITEFELSNTNNDVIVWDITSPLNPFQVSTVNSANTLTFKSETSSLREFVAYNGGFQSVQLLGSVVNQNLHALTGVDMVIVSPLDFLLEAERLADFHRDHDMLGVEVVLPEQIFNEFSSGSQDVSAIRDFAKYLYDSSDNQFKYLLLFGDASYDPKNRILNNTNYIVSYQSANSHSETNSYITDDFFAFLDDEESINSNSSLPFLDIGVGRFPVKSLDEARIAVDKIFQYYENESMDPWRLNICFVGDDNDVPETIHTSQAEQLADELSMENPLYNIDKIYLDSYVQESTSGGQRCEAMNQAINERIEKGAFLINYTGHGGELGWAHERVLGLDDISAWENQFKLPLFMTATCEFSRFDDPSRNSAGEEVFLKEASGAIALFSTSRVVFTGGNMDLNESFFDHLFKKNQDGSRPRLGDIFRKTKNTVPFLTSINHRNFTLLGDPALQLAYPEHEVRLTGVIDSVQALSLVSMQGEVVDRNGNVLSDFNGVVYPSIYDKSISNQTLGQDQSPIIDFDLQNALLFRGQSTVDNGVFSFSFVVPKDINYSYGSGKASLYAKGYLGDEQVDAAGYNVDFIIGGTSANIVEDIDGPLVSIFMNDTTFQSGDVTNDSPNLLAFLFDVNGLNTVGTGIGRDAVAIIDEQSSQPIILNDFYESDLDSYQRGVINYPFLNLNEGLHTLRVKVWDVYNNSSEDYTEFFVSNSNLEIENLFNYPNPMINYTEFYFDNLIGGVLDVVLTITNLQGEQVAVLSQSLISNGNRYGPVSWAPSQLGGATLSPGLYVYNLLAISNKGEEYTNSGKLVIIK